MSDLVQIQQANPPSTDRRERMAQQARASRANATRRAYGCDWRVCEAWAAANGAQVLPADAQRVARFLPDMSASSPIPSTQTEWSTGAIRASGWPMPVSAGPNDERQLGFGRNIGSPGFQKAALGPSLRLQATPTN